MRHIRRTLEGFLFIMLVVGVVLVMVLVVDFLAKSPNVAVALVIVAGIVGLTYVAWRLGGVLEAFAKGADKDEDEA